MTIRRTWIVAASLAALVACSDELATSNNGTVDADDNEITLTMGVDLSHNAKATRGVPALIGTTRADETPTTPNYISLTEGTGIRLRMEGDWQRANASESERIIQHTLAKAGEAIVGEDRDLGFNLNHVIDYSPLLYWDDYGTNDPNNLDGKTKGLDIYAFAVDGIVTDKEFPTDLAAMPWNTEEPDPTTVGTLTTDLIVSNNLTAKSGSDEGRLTFDEHRAIRHYYNGIESEYVSKADPKQARLVFKHVLSKFTFNIKAANASQNHLFDEPPTVLLTRDRINVTKHVPYCYTNGTVDLTTGVATHDDTMVELTAKSTKRLLNGHAVDTQNTQLDGITEEAIVYPGTQICDGSYADEQIIAQIRAYGNIYYVRGKAIIDAILEAFPDEDEATSFLAKPGYNYVFNITLSKTGITVTATVVDWNTVVSAEQYPKIDVTAAVGDKANGSATLTEFSFYRLADESLTTESGTIEAKYGKYSDDFKNGNYYAEETFVNSTPNTGKPNDCAFDTPLYWPNHQTHYHFRGVYPRTVVTDVIGKPTVEDATINGKTVQAIKVKNSKYNATEFPSNLMIGMPEIAKGTMCGNDDHLNGKQVDMSQHGVCAREGSEGGVVNLNFRYMMSQVQVNLSTSAEGSTDRLLLDKNTIVEIENAQTEGWIGLHSRAVEAYKTKGLYSLNNKDGAPLTRHDAVIPQALAGLKFKITVFDAEGKKSVYRATIADIQVQTSDADGGNGEGDWTCITAWEAGKKYIYNLKLTKTKLSVTATITDWTTKTSSSTDIWL